MAHLLCGPSSGALGAHSSCSSCSSSILSYAPSNYRSCLRRGAVLTSGYHSLTNHRTTNQLVSAAPRPRCLASALTARANPSARNGRDSTDSNDDDGIAAGRAAAEAESQQILEWPAICKQVACFCGTSVASDLVARGHLPRGRSREGSELLLQQTAEAVEANLEVRGCFDIRPAVEAAAAGSCLNSKQFEGVASTLEAAFALKACVTATQAGAGQQQPLQQQPLQQQPLRFPSLAALAESISNEERTLLRAIRSCIKFNSVSDEASEALAAVRADRQANKERLRAEVDMWARAMQAKGAAESGSVSIVRGRFCVGVRAGRQGDLPKGSVRLSSSSTGATLYVEPKPCVELNNTEALLAEREELEVQRVLGLLSRMLGSRSGQLLALLDCITALDVVAARARHSRWLGAVRPSFTDGPHVSVFHVPGALHPVLMQRGLPHLPQPPSVDDNRFDRDFQAAPAWELRRVLVPDGPRPGEMADGTVAAAGGGGGGSRGAEAAAAGASLLPRPLDLRVPEGRAVVAITGPNTGGKTVSLKAAGLMVLMAQAGLYLPCDPGQLAAHGPPRLAWFDQVLADIGDAQSLQQNLSTFSGHIRRIRQILAYAGGRSLVLLDEVGSGTDPLEGAALARAVLDRLAAQAHLTLATTHHAELKRASDEDARYINVSMEFDTSTLRPTYRLCWGAAGTSNALDIAETLGFDRSIVMEAREVARAMAASSAAAAASGRDSHIAGVARSLVLQLEETEQELEAQRALRARRGEVQARVQATLAQVREMEYELKLSPRDIVMERDRLASEVQSALDAFAAGLQPQALVEEALRRIEVEIPEEVASYRGQGYAGDEGEDDGEALRPGDSVHVKSYGDMGNARVVSVKGDTVTVKFDTNMVFAGGARSGRSKKLRKREVQRIRVGASLPFGATDWMASYNSLAADVSGVLGEISEQERAAATEAAATAARLAAQRTRQQLEMAAAEAGEASYDDLYTALEIDDISDDIDQDYGNPDVTSLVAGLDDDDEDHDDDDGWAPRKATAPPSRRPAAPAAPAGPAGSATVFALVPQTADNTIDLAGEVPELAAADLDEYMGSAPTGSVFFVRHGLGTGAVRDAVQELLAKRLSPKGPVREWREAPGSRGEVTSVWL